MFDGAVRATRRTIDGPNFRFIIAICMYVESVRLLDEIRQVNGSDGGNGRAIFWRHVCANKCENVGS